MKKALTILAVGVTLLNVTNPDQPDVTAPAQNVEFVLYHSDNIEATGFVEHLKLPHYVDFQSELQNVRRLQAEVERTQQLPEAAQ